MKLYHGSNQIVEKPRIITNGFYKDFGYGFYCTALERQAIRWAMTRKNQHIVNEYEFSSLENLSVLKFESMTAEWLKFVVENRSGKQHDFDIVEGPMADDTIWDYIEEYLAGVISDTAFWELVKFRHPTHQMVFCTEESLKALHFIKSKQYE